MTTDYFICYYIKIATVSDSYLRFNEGIVQLFDFK